MYCQKCGKENPDNAQVCISCSSALTTTPAQAPALIPKTSGLAIASFVLAILSPFTCLMTAIPAVILGIISLVQIGKSSGKLKGNGFAVAGIAVPFVALPILAMLMGILMPALARTRQIAFRMVCATNMSGLGKAMMIYSNDYDDKFPASSKWCDLLIQHTEISPLHLQCKGATEGPCNYAMNDNIDKLNINSAPPDMVLLFETYPGWNQSGGHELLTTENHQNDGCNVLFVDNHVEFVRTEDLKNLKWEPD